MKIVIIGAGFAGLSCAIRLKNLFCGIEIIVLDKKDTFDFLPSLPDTIGRAMAPELLRYHISSIAERKGFVFIKDKVVSIDFQNKIVSAVSVSVIYDYLVIASGTETTFYGNDDIRKYAYTLDNVDDAKKIISMLEEKNFDNFVVCGGGYTGIEVATNVRRFILNNHKKSKVFIVEKAQSILGPLPDWMKRHTMENLLRLNIEVLFQSSVERIDGSQVYLSNGVIFTNAFIIWAAGVQSPDFLQSLNLKKNPQGRLETDEYLRINNHCFVVGDAAWFKEKGTYLRMAVQFAIAEGDSAAMNIVNTIKQRKLIKYKPRDFGYVVPMANNNSCGNIFGLNLKGKLPTLLHFIMCVYRLYGLKNKIGFINNLMGIK